jgi:hypothetical protein
MQIAISELSSLSAQFITALDELSNPATFNNSRVLQASFGVSQIGIDAEQGQKPVEEEKHGISGFPCPPGEVQNHAEA